MPYKSDAKNVTAQAISSVGNNVAAELERGENYFKTTLEDYVYDGIQQSVIRQTDRSYGDGMGEALTGALESGKIVNIWCQDEYAMRVALLAALTSDKDIVDGCIDPVFVARDASQDIPLDSSASFLAKILDLELGRCMTLSEAVNLAGKREDEIQEFYKFIVYHAEQYQPEEILRLAAAVAKYTGYPDEADEDYYPDLYFSLVLISEDDSWTRDERDSPFGIVDAAVKLGRITHLYGGEQYEAIRLGRSKWLDKYAEVWRASSI